MTLTVLSRLKLGSRPMMAPSERLTSINKLAHETKTREERPIGRSLSMRENQDIRTASIDDIIPTPPVRAVTIYCCYHKNKRDKTLWEQLTRHFAVMTRSERVVIHDCDSTLPGIIREHQHNAGLAAADIILLLLSADFAYDDFCWETMVQALQRQERGEGRVIFILLRPFHYEEAPFARFQMLPQEKPLTKWSDLDEACEHVVKGVNKAVEELRRKWEQETGVEMPIPPCSKEREQLVVQPSETMSLINVERRVLHNEDGKH